MTALVAEIVKQGFLRRGGGLISNRLDKTHPRTTQVLIDYLRRHGPGHLYATSISPGAAQQILSAIKLIDGDDGSSRGHDKVSSVFCGCGVPVLYYVLTKTSVSVCMFVTVGSIRGSVVWTGAGAGR